jgi:hypothetical protein
MKRLALAAAGAALIGVTGCSHGAAPAATPTHHTAASAAAAPGGCGQQYRAWRNGPGKSLLGALHAVSVADRGGDSQRLTVALRRARSAVTRAAHHPVPACADPRGYWSVLLMHVNAAVTSKAPASSVRAALQDVPVINHRLIVELRRNAR